MANPVPETPRPHEQEVELPAGNNAFQFKLAKQSFVALVRQDIELVRSDTADEVVRLMAQPGKYTLRTDGEVKSVKAVNIELSLNPFEAMMAAGGPFQLNLSSDAPDQHVVDGIGEVKADGTSFCSIVVRKLDHESKPMNSDADNDQVFLRSTGGTLMNAQGKKRARSVKLAKGEARFRLVSETQPRLVTVTVMTGMPLPVSAELRIEFV